MRFCIVIMTAVITAVNVPAQVFEQIHLRDGSVLEGYICEQVPGKSLSVQTARATLTAAGDSLQSSRERQVMVADLPSEWKTWVMAQPASMDRVALTELKFTNIEFKDVLVLENGPEVRFLSLAEKVYTFPWSKVAKTVKQPRENGVISNQS